MSILKLSGFVMAMALLLGGCQQSENTQPTPTTKSETAANEFIVATEANFFPLRHRDGVDVAGYQVELLREMAKAADLNLTFSVTANARHLDLLSNASYVATLGTFDPTPENKALADFTDPITVMNYMVHLRAVDKDSMGTLSDLHGKKIAIDGYYASNPEFIKLLTQLTGSPDNIIVRDTFFLAWREMIAGEADGVFGENLVMDYTNLTHGKNVGLKVKKIDLNLPENNRALLVKKGNENLVARLNGDLAKMKTDGSYDALYQKWFSPDKMKQFFSQRRYCRSCQPLKTKKY